MNRENIDRQAVTAALVILAQALDIDPAAMMVDAKTTPDGMYVIRVVIEPDDDPTPEDVVSEAERIISNGR